jgi:predicted Zn-dependent protease
LVISLWLAFFASAWLVVCLARLSISARLLFAKFQVSLSAWVESVSSGNLAFWLYQVSKANVFFGYKFWSVKGL